MERGQVEILEPVFEALHKLFETYIPPISAMARRWHHRRSTLGTMLRDSLHTPAGALDVIGDIRARRLQEGKGRLLPRTSIFHAYEERPKKQKASGPAWGEGAGPAPGP